VTEVAHIQTAKVQCCNEAIEELRGLLAMAEAGEIVAVSGVVDLANGKYQYFGSTTQDRRKTAGGLLDAAMQRLGYSEP
jgi:hypothetical protein